MSAIKPPILLDCGPWHVECLCFGKGDEFLIAFHGFDNDAADFAVFEPYLSQHYTIISVNLFFHGNSFIDGPPANAEFTADELNKLFIVLKKHFRSERFSLLGFSLGGRICLSLMESHGKYIDRVFLLAPDGLRINPWYRFVTSHPVGRWLFQRVKEKPRIFLKVADILRAMRLVGEKQYRFAWAHFNTTAKRMKVYNVWMVFRQILPDIDKIRQVIVRYNIRVDLIFGKRDAFIRSSHAKRLVTGITDQCRIHELETGHNLLKPEIGELIVRLMKSEK